MHCGLTVPLFNRAVSAFRGGLADDSVKLPGKSGFDRPLRVGVDFVTPNACISRCLVDYDLVGDCLVDCGIPPPNGV
jgi:hypothetical protein